jgi:hypothetical protein
MDAVDELHVFINGCTRPDVLNYLRGEVERFGGVFTAQEGRLIHGQATRVLVEHCAADAVMLIEDDAYVRDAVAVRRALERVGSGLVDVIGTPRGGMDPEIQAYATQKWGGFECEDGGEGPGLWPCFLFARLETLMATDRRFESWCWHPGDVIPGLDYFVEDRDQTTDTCTAVAFQLRGASLRIEDCVQHKELWHKRLPVRGAPWFHAGGLSNLDPLSGDFHGDVRPDIGGTNEGLDWAHRLWWLRHIVETAGDLFPEHQAPYRRHLEEIIAYTGVGAEVEAWTETLVPWINWDDQG